MPKRDARNQETPPVVLTVTGMRHQDGMSEMDDRGRAFLDETMPHLDVLHRVARNVCRDHHRAEDLVQETYLRAFAAFQPGAVHNTRAWLVTICLNLARSDGRRRARRVVETSLTDLTENDMRLAGVDEEVLAHIDRETVSRALGQLPYDQRVAIVLMDLANFTAAEVGTTLGCSRNTVLSRVFRGRQSLARLLTEQNLDRDLS
jgi:RNA polymerase sigma-70 factor (ECF subfamily)